MKNTALRGIRRRTGLSASLWALAAILLSSTAMAAAAADPPANGRRPGVVTVGVLSAGDGGGDVRIVGDLAAVLDDPDRLRIVPIVGRGGTRNIADLTSVPAVADVAIVQADALDTLKNSDASSRSERQLFYIAKLFNEEVHVIAAADVQSLADLGGKKVAVGVEGSGPSVTARAIFAALAIPIEPLTLDPASALEKLKAGEIAAMLAVGGKPYGSAPAFSQAAGGSGQLHLLSIPVNDALLAAYVPSTLTANDYPDLIAAGETIETISVPVVMLAASAERGSERGRRVDVFVESFFNNFAKFTEPPRHPKWREVNLAASVSGRRRLPVALDWVRVNMATAEEKKLHAAFDDMLRFLAQEGIRPGSKALGEREREALFWQFVDWRAGQPAN